MTQRKRERVYGFAALICLGLGVLVLGLMSGTRGETMGDDYAGVLLIVAVVLAAAWRRRRRARIAAEVQAEAYQMAQLRTVLREGADMAAQNVARLRATAANPQNRR
jgi:MYXO-CTERM domain-containing protein